MAPRPCVEAAGGPHGLPNFTADLSGGTMNGFLSEARSAARSCTFKLSPACGIGSGNDVLGYHTKSDIPNYWAYAHHFVLQDHMFAPVSSWSLPEHLSQVSGWSAQCACADPMSCTSNITRPSAPPRRRGKPQPTFAWTDLTYLLHRAGVSWGYYVTRGSEPDCRSSSAVACALVGQSAAKPGIWNPLPDFATVRQDQQLANIQQT